MSNKFVFVAWDGGGNVVPMLLIIKKLVNRGHTVTLVGNESLRARTQQAGALFLPYQKYGLHNPKNRQDDIVRSWEASRASEVSALIRERMLFGPAASIANDVLKAVENVQPDAIVVDYVMFGGFIAAESVVKPWAIMVPHGYPLPHAGCRGRGPFTYLFQRMIAPGLDSLNSVRAALGLSHLTSVVEQYNRATRILLTTYRFFDMPGPEVPHRAVYVGSQLNVPECPSNGAPVGSRPLVLVSLSTVYQSQESLLAKIINVLSTLPVNALVLTGDASDKQGFESAGNIEIKSFVPHAAVLPQVTAMITHAGHGTVMGALEHAVPILCIPCTQDQFDNAGRVAEMGAGIYLPSHSKEETLKTAIERILIDREYSENARRARESILAEYNPMLAIKELEKLCLAASV